MDGWMAGEGCRQRVTCTCAALRDAMDGRSVLFGSRIQHGSGTGTSEFCARSARAATRTLTHKNTSHSPGATTQSQTNVAIGCLLIVFTAYDRSTLSRAPPHRLTVTVPVPSQFLLVVLLLVVPLAMHCCTVLPRGETSIGAASSFYVLYFRSSRCLSRQTARTGPRSRTEPLARRFALSLLLPNHTAQTES